MITVGSSPSAIAINPTGTRLYVSNGGGSTVSVINTATNLELTRVTVGSQPSGLAVSPDGTRLYALSRASDAVTAIQRGQSGDRQCGGGGFAARCGAQPRWAAAYVSNYTSGTVTVLNTTAATRGVVKTITVGTQPEGIAISKDGSLVYVANGTDTVSVINTATNTVRLDDHDRLRLPSPMRTRSRSAATPCMSPTTIDDWVRAINLARVQTPPQANGHPPWATDPPPARSPDR